MISLHLEKLDQRTTVKPVVKVLVYNPLMNKEIEIPREYYGIIDTGSDVTCICEKVIEELLLSERNEIILNNDIKGILFESPIREIDISIPGLFDFYITIETGYFKERLTRQGEKPIHLLIGRDILKKCVTNYHGPNEIMTIEWVK